MAFDAVLYLAFVAGLVAGRVARWRSPWIGRAQWASVLVLVFLLGASLAAIPTPALLTTIPEALALALVIVAATLGGFAVLRPRPLPSPPRPSAPTPRVVAAPVLLTALVAGYLTLGRFDSAMATPIGLALDALLFLVAFDLTLSRSAIREIWRPLAAAVLGAMVASAFAVILLDVPPIPSLATTLAFGWYSLAGPLVSAQRGPTLGLLAFLANFLREDLTMLLSRPVGARFPHGGIAAVGGATAMDTTLPFSSAYDPPEGATLGLGTGIVLTIAASLLVPGLLTLA